MERQELMGAGGSEVDLAVRQFFRPYVLAFLSLAVIFGGWSYGYKLSQYLEHPEVTRASLTRAWIDHREDSFVAVSNQRVFPHKTLEVGPFGSAALRISERTPDLPVEELAPAREALLCFSLVPFRAPPAINPSLA